MSLAVKKRIASLVFITFPGLSGSLLAQDPTIHRGTPVPTECKVIYDKGLSYLVAQQSEDGRWGRDNGVTAICAMAFMASGEDPNFGRYAEVIRKSIRGLIRQQEEGSGYIGSCMYRHGFSTLALAEAYGVLDDRRLWEGDDTPKSRRRSIAAALELAVRRIVTSQKKNKVGGWRYSPSSRDADTSVSGAVFVGLLAARNAGIEVPDTAVERALQYYRSMTSKTGFVAYAGGMGGFGDSMNRSAICALVFSLARRKDDPSYKAAFAHIRKRIDHNENGRQWYFRYYMAQALFQGDIEAFNMWNKDNIRALARQQGEDGSFRGGQGQAYATGMALLSLALNYRFLPIYER